MRSRTSTMLAAVTVGLAVGACGGANSSHPISSAAKAPTSIQDTASPGVNEVALMTGSPAQQITATIQAFYRETWQNHGSAACSLFSAYGRTGFLQSAKVAFPQSVNAETTCPEVMTYYNADLTDSADTLQQSGVNVSGNILNVVGVSHIKVSGNAATAEAPDGVEEFIKPKTFFLIRENGHWLINGTARIGLTLAQELQQAEKHGELKGSHT